MSKKTKKQKVGGQVKPEKPVNQAKPEKREKKGNALKICLTLPGGDKLTAVSKSVYETLTDFVPKLPVFIKGSGTLVVSSNKKSISINIPPIVLKRIRMNKSLRLILEKRVMTVFNG